ncbi:MAG: type II toxin-antitoxin system death-on-curing family toxin [Pseudomonadota bacterium]|nr:type II toxin-antitoxin system death-on-curing family toxin [Pseudomonadota bacterium]
MTYGKEDLYGDVYAKAAVLAHGISEGQPFVDGNKRTALVSALAFLKVNGHGVLPAEERLYEAMIGIANRKTSKEDLAQLFRELDCEFNTRRD